MSFIPPFGARRSSAHRLGRMTSPSHRTWPSRIARLAVAGLALLASAPACLHAQAAYFSGVTSTIDNTYFTQPYDLSLDSHGNLYVADFGNGNGTNTKVAVMTPDGNGGFSAPAPVLTSTTFIAPGDVVADAAGNLFVADYGNPNNGQPGQVWEILAGSTSARAAIRVGSGWVAPSALVLDSQQQFLFVSDAGAGTVTRIRLSNLSTDSVNYQFSTPTGVTLDSSGNLYVAETGGTIEKIPSALASSPAAFTSAGPTQVGTAIFNFPTGISIDASGNLWIAESDGPAIREMLAPNYTAVKSWGSGFVTPIGVAWDPDGNVIVADSDTTVHAIEQIATGGVNFGLSAIGAPSTSSPITLQFGFLTSNTGVVPSVVTQGKAGADFRIDSTTPGTCQSNGPTQTYNAGDSCTVMVDFDPAVSGTRYGAVQVAGATGYVYGTGTGPQFVYIAPQADIQRTLGTYSNPAGLAVDGNGNVFVADAGAGKVDEISGVTSTAIGGTFMSPAAVAVDGAGNVFVADDGTKTIDEIPLNGSTYGSATALSLTLGGSAFAFTDPVGIAVDASGNLFVADKTAPGVYEILAASSYTVVVQLGIGFSFTAPSALAVDGSGNLYVADAGLNAIYELTDATGYASPSGPLVGGLSAPAGVAVDGSGNLFFTSGNNLEELPVGGAVGPLATSATTPYAGIAVDGGRNVYTDNGTVLKLDYADSPILNFASAQYMQPSSDNPQSVVIENVGTGTASTATLSGVTVNNNGGGSFAETAGLGTPADCSSVSTLAASSACDISINFTPQSVAAISGSVQLTESSPSGPQTISLAGTGTLATTTVSASSTSTLYSVNAQNVTLTATVTAVGSTVNEGTVSFMVYQGPTVIGMTTTSSTVSGGSASVNYAIPAGQAGGTYTIQASYDDTGGSYNTSTQGAPPPTLTITTASQAGLTVNVTSPAIYGTTQTLTTTGGSGTGAVTYSVGSSTACSVSGATLTISAGTGTCAVTATKAADSDYSAESSTAAPVTVQQATLTVTANNATRAYGAANPAFTVTITGFVNSDPSSVVSGTPAFGTTATATSPVGPYPITPSVGTLSAANYTFTFVNGTLTITQATLTVTANNATRAYGAANPTFTATITGFLNNDPASVVAGTPAFSTTATIASPVGPYPITPSAGTLSATNYTFAFVNGTLTITQAAPIIFWAAPAPIAYGTPLSSTQLDASSGVAGSFAYTPPAGTVLSVGAGQTLSVTLTPTDTADYTSATATVAINVTAAAPTISFPVPNHAYGDPAFTVTATSNSTGAFTYSVVSGPATVSGNKVTLTGAGSVVLQASEAAAGNYGAGSGQTTIVVAKQASQTTVTTNSASITPGQSVTLTATVAPAVLGTPTGAVTFFSGTTALGSPVTLTNSTAQLVVSSLVLGANSISATYSGDTNFLGSSGSLNGGITVVPLSFTMSASPASRIGVAGTTFAYDVTVTPTSGSYPGTVSFAASGLPSGATAVFSPSTLAANAGQQTIGLAIVTASATSALHALPVGGKLAPVALALLLLPWAGTRRMRRQGQRFGRFVCLLLFALAGVVATTALTGCGASVYHQLAPKNYTITITGTSGAVQQTTTVNLSLQ